MNLMTVIIKCQVTCELTYHIRSMIC